MSSRFLEIAYGPTRGDVLRQDGIPALQQVLATNGIDKTPIGGNFESNAYDFVRIDCTNWQEYDAILSVLKANGYEIRQEM